LAFGRLWQRQGLAELIQLLADGMKFRFDVERVVLGLTLQRLCVPDSDFQCHGWLQTIEAEGFEALLTVFWIAGF